MDPRIVERPAFHVVGMAGRFTPETMREIPSLWARFVPKMGTVPGRKGVESFGLCHEKSKDERGEPTMRYTACVEVESLAAVPKGMVGMTVPANTYAVFTHTGPIATIGQTIDSIWKKWIPERGFQVAPGPDFERYDERFDGKKGEGPVEVFVPIRKPSA